MAANDWLAERFEAHRAHLRAVAHRMLGATADADDAVQETWLRLNRSDVESIDNLSGWLTTVVARVALDMLRARERRDATADRYHELAGPAPKHSTASAESEVVLADSVGAALLVVLDTLAPAERLAFVLHDLFAVPFDEIARVLGRSPAATKMLASRARRKVQGSESSPDLDPLRQRHIVDAFLAASRSGDFDALLAVLHPEVVLVADAAAVRLGCPGELRGARAVAGTFTGRALAAQPALVDGAVGVVWAVDGRPRVVWDFVIADGRVVHIDMLAVPETLRRLELDILR